jgi:hypothetical protein
VHFFDMPLYSAAPPLGGVMVKANKNAIAGASVRVIRHLRSEFHSFRR